MSHQALPAAPRWTLGMQRSQPTQHDTTHHSIEYRSIHKNPRWMLYQYKPPCTGCPVSVFVYQAFADSCSLLTDVLYVGFRLHMHANGEEPTHPARKRPQRM